MPKRQTTNCPPPAIYDPYFGTPTCDDPHKEIVPLSSLFPDAENANLHPERNVRAIRASLRQRGQVTPIVVTADGIILKGNGTHQAAMLEGWTHIWIVRTAMTGAEARAYAIADNQTGKTSEWSWERLASQIGELKNFSDGEFEFDLDALGFEDHEVEPLLAADWTPTSATESDTADVTSEDHAASQPEDEGDRADHAHALVLTPNQRLVFDQAVERLRQINNDFSITEGACLELICADYIASPNPV